MEPEIIAALIGLGGVVLGVILSIMVKWFRERRGEFIELTRTGAQKIQVEELDGLSLSYKGNDVDEVFFNTYG